MLTIYSDDHHLHHGKYELIDGQLTPCFEKPSRADMVLARAQKVKLGDVVAPREFGLAGEMRTRFAPRPRGSLTHRNDSLFASDLGFALLCLQAEPLPSGLHRVLAFDLASIALLIVAWVVDRRQARGGPSRRCGSAER